MHTLEGMHYFYFYLLAAQELRTQQIILSMVFLKKLKKKRKEKERERKERVKDAAGKGKKLYKRSPAISSHLANTNKKPLPLTLPLPLHP